MTRGVGSRGFPFFSTPAVTGLLILFSCGCSNQGQGLAADIGTTRAALVAAATNSPVLGFEDATKWLATTGFLSLNNQHTQGQKSLAVAHPVNYTAITSTKLSSGGGGLAGMAQGVSWAFDLLLPHQQPIPQWWGEAQLFMNAPSRGVVAAFAGNVELTGMPVDVFQTLEFKIPDDAAAKLAGATYGDLTITIILNVPFAGTGTYLLDNLRLKGAEGSLINVRPVLDCVTQRDATHFDALFGYVNESAHDVDIDVGGQNGFLPALQGRGQAETFHPGRIDGAFAVRFDGTDLTWSMLGGTVTANAQSVRCAATTCAKACARGEQCTGGSCVTECGDGLCAGDENCRTCAADCACAAGLSCFQSACVRPAQCGVDWECGAGSSAGNIVDCGSCGGGRTCVEHVCQ